MHVGAPQIEAATIGFGQHPRRDDIDESANSSDDQNKTPVHSMRVDESLDGFDGNKQGDRHQCNSIGRRRKDLRPLETEGPAALGRTSREANGPRTESECGDISRHMTSVGEQHQ